MLTMLLGPDHRVTTNAMFGRLLSRVRSGDGMQILVVPEQFSFAMEKRLCAEGGDTVSRFAEVLSLSRLAVRVQSILGGVSRPWLDQGGALLAAAQAVEQALSRLKLYAPVCRRPEFLRQLLSAVQEFGSYGVTPETIRTASGRFSGQFAQKLEETALLYESYLSVTARAQDAITRLRFLHNVLADSDFPAGKTFFFCGFTDFTALERQIVEDLILTAKDVFLVLPEETACGAPVFPSSAQTASYFRRFCAERGVQLYSEHLPFSEGIPDDLAYLQRHAASEAAPYAGKAENVSFTLYPTPEAECRATARRVRLLLKQGSRLRDIGIACADLSSCRTVAEEVFTRAGLPYFLSVRDSLTQNSGARMLLSALRAVSGGMEKDDVIDWLKSGAPDLSDEDCDRLERYALKWNIHGRGWNTQWTKNPSGVREFTDDDRRLLSELNEQKTAALSPLIALHASMGNAKTAGEMTEAAAAYLQSVHLSEKMQRISDELFEDGRFQQAQQYAQTCEKLLSALTQSSMMLSDCVRTPEEFCRLTEALLEQYDVQAVPAAADQIFIGEIAAFRAHPVRHLLILGASDGVFPAVSASCGIFSEQERKKLLSSGVPMAPLRTDAVERDLGSIYQTLRSAFSSLHLSASGDEPSYLLRRFSALFGGLSRDDTEEVLLDEAEADAETIRTSPQLPEQASAGLRELAARARYRFGSVEEQTVRGLYGSSFRFSPTQLDRLTGCRFAYFLSYGLRAKEDEPVTFDAPAFGTFVHEVLEKTAKTVRERGGFGSVSEEQTASIAAAEADRYAQEQLFPLLEDPRFRFLFARNREEAIAVSRSLAQELAVSDFVPEAFELEFGEGKSLAPIRAEGGHASCRVIGTIDRADLFRTGDKTYVRVVDYKTGSKKLNYAELAEGKGMQMLLYLFALRDSGNALFGTELIPAGVQYFPAKYELLTAKEELTAEDAEKLRNSRHERGGLLLQKDEVLEAMEHFDGEPKFLPHTMNHGKLTLKDLADKEQFALLEHHVFRRLGELADELAEGRITPNPLRRGEQHSACDRCEFRDVCHKDFVPSENRNRRELKPEEFFDDLRRKEARHG